MALSFSRRAMLRRAGLLLSAAGACASSNRVAQGVAVAASISAESKTLPLSPEEIAALDAALGKKGSYAETEGVYTMALPRNDLQVRIKGESVPLVFGGWVSLKRSLDGEAAVLISQNVLLEEEVNPLISVAQNRDLQVGAIHNGFFYENPRIFYMHLHGMGDPVELAGKYGAAIEATKLYPSNQPPASTVPGTRLAGKAFDLAALDQVVGHAGKMNGLTYQYVVGRDDVRVIARGAELTAAMGLNTGAAFFGEGDRTHMAGHVALLETEVNPVIQALRRHKLEVVALHQHLLEEQPRVIFLHYYGRGTALSLAQGFRAALDRLDAKET